MSILATKRKKQFIYFILTANDGRPEPRMSSAGNICDKMSINKDEKENTSIKH